MDVRTKNVLWSVYVPVKEGGPAEMERVAKRVSREMKKASGTK